MSVLPDPSEADYTNAAHAALERGDYRLAFEQIGGALSFRPNAPELRALLDLALSRSRQPLAVLPHSGSAFFGIGAVRAAAFARSGKLGDAIVQLLDVVTFRPTAPFLLWLDDWRGRDFRGVGVAAIAASVARFHDAIDREGHVAPENLSSLAALLAALRKERPKAGELLVRLEAVTLRQLGDYERAMSVVDEALATAPSPALLLERGLTQRAKADFAGAVESLERALGASSRKDSGIAGELADALLGAGRLDLARRCYESLRGTELDARATAACLALDALAAPEDAASREAALAAEQVPRELAFALRVGRTALPAWEDVLSSALPDLIARIRIAPPPDRKVRVRLQLDRPLPRSARVLFAVAASRLGVSGDLVTDGAAEDLAEHVTPSDESRAMLRDLAPSPLDIDAWIQEGPALEPEEAARAFAFPLDDALDGAEAFELQRLRALCLALRGVTDPDDARAAWVSALAGADDAWAARAAILALGALARRRPAFLPVVTAALGRASSFDDARAAAVNAVRLHLPTSDLTTRGEAVAALLVGLARRNR